MMAMGQMMASAPLSFAPVDVCAPTLDDRLDNWGQALRSGRICGQTASLEGNYRPPHGAGWWDRVAPRNRAAIDARDAQDLESAVCTLPLFHHALLRSWYVKRLDPFVCLRLAAKAAGQAVGRSSGFSASLSMAHELLIAALTLPAVVRKVRARALVQEVLAG